MNLLLDTHILLWWLSDDQRLSWVHRAVIVDPSNSVFVSAASVWEISIKRAMGKLTAPQGVADAIGQSELEALPITLEHAEAAGELPDHHRDPFDRMIVAQAVVENLAVATTDANIRRYAVNLL